MNKKSKYGKMRRLLSAVMAAVTLSSGFAALSVSADDRAVGVVLYVSPSGDDSAAGTLGAPLRTLEGARDAVSLSLPRRTVQPRPAR